MEKRKVQMGSTYLYSGYRKKGRQSWGSTPNTSASVLPSHPALSGRGALGGVDMSLTLTLPPSLSHAQKGRQDTVQDKA